MKQKIMWTIAGYDSSGSAGIQTDLRVAEQLGVQACAVITAVTAQNDREVKECHYLPPTLITSQISSLTQDFKPEAIKIGMIGEVGILLKIKAYLETYQGMTVLDPLLFSSSNYPLFTGRVENYCSHLKTLFPFIDVLTPNIFEAEAIVNFSIQSEEDRVKAANHILSLGVKSVLIKGGHAAHPHFSHDYWTDGVASFWLSNKRYPLANYRGTGCLFSSALAGVLALSFNIKDALVIAKMVVSRAIRLSGESLPTGWPEEEIDLPFITSKPLNQIPKPFPICKPLGLYPVVDNIAWLETVLLAGSKMVQLRIKNKIGDELEQVIKASIQLARKYQAKLFINDYWQLAITHQADGVHLGQEDILTADIARIREAGLYLGISTHCYYEVARAHAIHPSYVACGPIYPTTSKRMPFAPQGLLALKRWRRTLTYPLVAIGGINSDNLPDILKTKVEGVALISAITQARDPLQATKTLLEQVAIYADT